LRTGDLGTIDANGNVTIAGRSEHVVHTAGFSVHPAEVEGFLETYPGVVSAAVVGIPHPELGEALAAYVVTTPGTSLDRRAVMRFCQAGIAGYKVPYGVEVVRELPLLVSGKPDRAALTRDAQAL
jgi:acyl-CoA synthetase (AMP-forming)/AMP-acid ligase II